MASAVAPSFLPIYSPLTPLFVAPMLVFAPFPLSELHYLLGGSECIFACLYYFCIFLP